MKQQLYKLEILLFI